MDLSAHRCLVDCDWLEAHLDEPSLVVIEATDDEQAAHDAFVEKIRNSV